MGGVVYAPGSINAGLYGNPIALTAGAVVPPGWYFMTEGATITCPNGTTQEILGGLVVSDGTNCVATAAGNAVPLGGGPQPTWPWPPPWPVGIT